jgi:hypothetical protein
MGVVLTTNFFIHMHMLEEKGLEFFLVVRELVGGNMHEVYIAVTTLGADLGEFWVSIASKKTPQGD